MDLTLKERDRRWASSREIMSKQGVDVVIAHSDFGDQAGLQRYLSNFRSPYDNQAVMLFKNDCELAVTHPGGVGLGTMLSWATGIFPLSAPENVSDSKPSLGGTIANRLNSHSVKKVGIIGIELFPHGWINTIKASIPDAVFVDVWDDFHQLRLVKSLEEQTIIRESCRISDLAWEKMPEIMRIGRKRFEVLADIEHIIRSNNCEDSFNLCYELPMMQHKIDRNPFSALPIEKNSTYNLEVSPRFLGYFGQQTGMITMGKTPSDLLHAYDTVNRAREAGLSVMKPGVDLIEAGHAVAEQLIKDGIKQPAPSFGHGVGLELEDHHISGGSLILKEGMTFIFHPFAPTHPGVMRADTYLITSDGVERITSGNINALELN